ncbi:MAG: efflux RND transporter permease subunit [Rubripirellula sp.]
MIRWFTINGIAANFLMLAIIVSGSYVAINHVPLEVTPALSWNTVMIEMQYRGATAKDVEQAILIPIEAVLEGVDGIDSLNADGFRGGAKFFLRASRGKDLRNLMDDVKARIDTITTFPAETEPPRVLIPESANYYDILQIAVMGNLSPHDMRRVSRQVQKDLLEMPGISRVDIRGDKESEVSIEANVEKLLAYNLSFQDLADAIRGFSIDLPAGAIDSNSGTFIVRTRGQAYSEDEFNDIPIRSAAGAEVRLGEVATIRDGFVEGDQKMFFNGKPALFVPVMRVGSESALGISNEVREYVRTARTRFPDGIELEIWDDESLAIRHRLSTLGWSLLQGGLFVLLILGMFIRPSLAFWIVIGIPVSFAGAALFMPWFDLTANVMSLFGFIIVMGIVVDDAIVTGENVYSKIMEGIDPLEAAIEGTREVATPVTFGALTTVVAFLPLMFFDGTWGDYARQVPPVVAPVLLFSLIESKLILPAHLKHLRRDTGRGLFARFQSAIALGLERFIVSVYQPTLRLAVRNRLTVVAGFVAMAMLMAGYCVGGRLGFVAFPSVDSTRISAKLELPSDTPLEVTERYVDRISDALDQLKTEFVDPGTGKSLVQNIVRLTGARRPGSDFEKSKGYLAFEVMPPEERSVPGPKNSDMATRWSELVGEMPEARRFETRSESSLVRDSEYDDEDLNIELRGPSSSEKSQVARDIRSLLEGYGDLKDVWANINERQDELEIRLKSRAAELGLTQSALASQIRQAFFGEEAQRLQRGVDDVRVMVRLPLEARQSLHTLDRMRIRTPRGAEVPLETVAEINLVKAPSHVERNDRAEIIRLGAQPVDETVDVVGISKELAPKLDAMCRKNGLSYQFLGYVAEAENTKRQTIVGATLLMLTLYGLLAIALKSMIQPLYVLLAVPFAIIGALVGHVLLDLTPSYLSIFGMLALAGIAVNDTLVMVDYINRRQASGVPLLDAALEAGGKRFRPIFLTSITTFMGLLPLMMDESIQAQFLIPMAVSLAFGVLFATAITLYMVPCVVLIGSDVSRYVKASARWYWSPLGDRTTGE